jgi:hypothetical protein
MTLFTCKLERREKKEKTRKTEVWLVASSNFKNCSSPKARQQLR